MLALLAFIPVLGLGSVLGQNSDRLIHTLVYLREGIKTGGIVNSFDFRHLALIIEFGTNLLICAVVNKMSMKTCLQMQVVTVL